MLPRKLGINGRRLEGGYADDLVSENGGEGCFSVLVFTSCLLDYTCHDSTLKIKKTLIFEKDEYLLYTVWPQYKVGEGKFWLKYKSLTANPILQLDLFSRNQIVQCTSLYHSLPRLEAMQRKLNSIGHTRSSFLQSIHSSAYSPPPRNNVQIIRAITIHSPLSTKDP